METVIAEPKESVAAVTETVSCYTVVLHNDDVNTFEFVIDTLVDVCSHSSVQAEQCAYLVHFKGKCDVKRGTFADLKPIRNELNRRGLTATIE